MMSHSQYLPTPVRNHPFRLVTLLLMFMIPLMLGCGSQDPPVSTPDTTADETTTSQPADTTSSTGGPSTTTPSDPLDVPMAIWVSSGPEADTPESAAEAAVRELLGVTPVLGEFQAGDSRSGEILVFSPGENGPMQRSLLLLRQMGPDEKWSVIAAINPDIGIDAPPAGSLQNAGMLTVSGMARGFEGTIIVSAHRVGADREVLDMRIAAGGALWDPEPFSVELNLNGTATGEVIAIVVRGDTGLDTDTGEFSAIAIRIG
jgi:hypothetical protein